MRIERAGMVLTLAASLTLASAGCASHLLSPCRAGEMSAISDSLYFGTLRPGGVVTTAEWATFLDEEVKSQFPRGFTSWEATGAWRGASGSVDHEASHVLVVVHPNDEANERAIQLVTSAYRTRFTQEAVLRVRSRACASFDPSPGSGLRRNGNRLRSR